ncbi:putative signaling protein [Methylobacterium dankookense]|uniref:Putative signaling protein n=2 Tax=Methylobacterium dankookense TaxID=560405 RepID=A0A564FSG5_9HYPH|nr:hypothetical protein IFDJLNFL_0760 [Methylobacterium dankookense]VUF11099.1 putative signaling protein [Methylobacterium dankookense]
MDVGFVSEFLNGNRVFRFSDSETYSNPVVVGASDPLDKSFCYYIARGLMPEIMHDARENPVAAQLPVTDALPVGAHLSVPLRYDDGTPFGTLCCFSFTPDRTLTTRDLGVLRLCADVVSAAMQKDRSAALDLEARRSRIEQVIAAGDLDMVFQPLYRVADAQLIGFEALSRFRPEPRRPPDTWFAEAEAVGLGEELKFLAVERALTAFSRLDPTLRLTLNLSPGAILGPRFASAITEALLHRVVIELTEHAEVPSYEALRSALAPARAKGLRLAIDDVGAGHATFRHVLDLAPEMIKLDRSLVHGIHTDNARRALAEALTMYGRRIGCEVVAEGIETADDYAILQDIGVTRAQGYLLGRPLPLAEAAALPLRHGTLAARA